MRTLFRPVLLALLLLLTAAPSAFAQGTKLDAILARGTVRIGLTGDYRPFSALDKATGQFEGLDVDMANSLGRALGAKVELVQTTWGGLLGDLAADKFDLAMGGISVTLERQKTAFFSVPVMRAGKAAIARCTDKDRFASLADIERRILWNALKRTGGVRKTAAALLGISFRSIRYKLAKYGISDVDSDEA